MSAWTTSKPAARLRLRAPALLAATGTLAGLAATGNATVLQALAGIALVAAAALLPTPRAAVTAAATPAPGAPAQPAPPEAILAALPDPAILLDRAGTVTGHNARAAALLPALQTGEAVSRALRVPEVLEAVRAALARGEPSTVSYAERVPVERWTEAHVTLAPGAGGRIVLLLLRDVTALRHAERMRVDFVANASHELRTPLASLLGFIETLQGPAREDTKARERFLEIMRVQASRMARLIDDLLSLSRIEQRQHMTPETPVDLAAAVRQVADALSPLAAERGVTLHQDLPGDAVTVRGDRDELIRLIENLVENGIKYGQSGKRVEIALDAGGTGEARFSVRDHGPGIPPEHLPRLTERFYRVDAADSREKGGTGLGLALVKHIAARHRARMSIESEPGDGARFSVTFPVAGEAR